MFYNVVDDVFHRSDDLSDITKRQTRRQEFECTNLEVISSFHKWKCISIVHPIDIYRHPIASNFDMRTEFLWPIRFSFCICAYANSISRPIALTFHATVWWPYQYSSWWVPATCQLVTVPQRAEQCWYSDRNCITDTIYSIYRVWQTALPIMHRCTFELLIGDRLFMLPGKGGFTEIRVYEDAFLQKLWGFKSKSAWGKNTVDSLRCISWAFVAPDMIIVEGRSHFNCEEVCEHCDSIGSKLHVVAAYSPWLNKLLEGSNGILLNALKWLCAPNLGDDNYAKMTIKDISSNWPEHLDTAIKHLNDQILPALKYSSNDLLLGLIMNSHHTDDPERLRHQSPNITRVCITSSTGTTSWQLCCNCWPCCEMQECVWCQITSTSTTEYCISTRGLSTGTCYRLGPHFCSHQKADPHVVRPSMHQDQTSQLKNPRRPTPQWHLQHKMPHIHTLHGDNIGNNRTGTPGDNWGKRGTCGRVGGNRDSLGCLVMLWLKDR